MDKLGKWALVRITLITIGLLYGTLHHFGQIPSGFNEGFTILLLLLLLELSVEILLEGRKDYPHDDWGIRSGRRNIVANLLVSLRQELDRALTPEMDGFRVAHRTLALSSFDTFWRLLVQEQETRRRDLQLKAIHSCDFEIWIDHSFTRSLIERHKAFISHNGKVARILCGRGLNPDVKIQKAARNMKDAGIEVFYFNMDEEAGISHDFSWDFLYAEDTKVAVIWASFTHLPHGIITEAIYLNSCDYQNQNLGSLWGEIRQRSIPFPFDGTANVR